MSKRFRFQHGSPASCRSWASAPRVLRRAALPADLFEQPKILVTTEELFALWRGIGALSRDPGLGLNSAAKTASNATTPSPSPPYTRCFGDALQRMARYKQLTCPEEIRIENRREECRVQFRWLLARETEPAILVDVCFAGFSRLRAPRNGAPPYLPSACN